MSEAVPWGCPVCLRPFPELPGSVSVPPPGSRLHEAGLPINWVISDKNTKYLWNNLEKREK